MKTACTMRIAACISIFIITTAVNAQSPVPTVPSKETLTAAEKNADFQKRRAEQAEKEKKAIEKSRMETEKIKNCDRAQAYRRILESGERITQTDKSGERYYLDDQQREQELRETERMLNDCK